jgi:hypothetical protein
MGVHWHCCARDCKSASQHSITLTMKVAFIAFRDWRFARKFEGEMNYLLHSKEDRVRGITDPEVALSSRTDESRNNTMDRIHASGRREYRWTRVHSHFALMGGFAFSTRNLEPNLFKQQIRRRMLTPDALRFIAGKRPELLPDISRDSIMDKSKANQFAKLLVCLQAFRFSAQMLGRLATGNPISPLELNVFLHAVSCLAIYIAWWDKPLDIEEPLDIGYYRDINSWRVCTWMVLHEDRGCLIRDPYGDVHGPSWSGHRWGLKYADTTLDVVAEAVRPRAPSTDHEHYVFGQDVSSDVKRILRNVPRDGRARFVLRLYVGQTCHGFRLACSCEDRPSKPRSHHTRGSVVSHPNVYTELNYGDLARLELINALRETDNTPSDWDYPENFKCPRTMFIDRIFMTDSPEGMRKRWEHALKVYLESIGAPDIAFSTILLIAGSFYGGVHLLAWNGPFPTPLERWLWRASCIVIACPGFMALFSYLKGAFKRTYLGGLTIAQFATQWLFGYDLSRILVGSAVFIAAGYTLIGVVCFCLAYIAARVYIVVECFLNLTHLPPGVYTQPSWSRYIPQFSAG